MLIKALQIAEAFIEKPFSNFNHECILQQTFFKTRG